MAKGRNSRVEENASSSIAVAERSANSVALEAVRGAGSGGEQEAEGDGKSGEIGVLEPLSKNEVRGSNGKFLPGHKVLPGAGRRPFDPTPDIRAAIWKRYTLEEILGRLDKAYEIAVELRSSRGIVAAVTPVLEYGLGKPIQQIVHEAGRNDLLEQLFESKDTPLLPPPAPMFKVIEEKNDE